ncbi:MAG: heparan-alpha-glucosaminide N-acetyltransferase domain-containing protein [Ferruginibacter sp.]
MTATTQRFTALDVFRGMTVCFMIIVNTPGNGATTFSPLLHAHWNGFTPTDLVFPSFLFAVGNAMSFVMPKWMSLSQSRVLLKIIKRTAIIFLLGFLMYWFPFMKRDLTGNFISFPFTDTRVFGVLQRIALCYGIASLIVYYCKPKTAVMISIVFLIAYWIILYAFGDAADPLAMQTNAGSHLDMWLLGEKHLYHGEGVAFDPEGLLSTMPAVANVIGGYIAGKFIQQKGNTYEGLTKLLFVGAGLLFLAYCINLNFPVNKKLWTSSFVLLTVGLDCIILSALIYIISFKKQTGFTYFFEVMGRNPLFIYLLSELGATLLYFFRADTKISLYQWGYTNLFKWTGDYLGSLLFAISFMLLCWLVGYVLDKRKIYIRV